MPVVVLFPTVRPDTGGEFVATYQVNIGFEAPQSWVVPTADLVSIFKIRYVAVHCACCAPAVHFSVLYCQR